MFERLSERDALLCVQMQVVCMLLSEYVPRG